MKREVKKAIEAALASAEIAEYDNEATIAAFQSQSVILALKNEVELFYLRMVEDSYYSEDW